MSDILLRGTPTTAAINAAGTITINVPTGVVNGDVLVMNVNVAGAGNVPATPSGWTLLDSQSAAGPTAASYYRVASSEPASYNITGANAIQATMRAYYNVDTTNPINAHGAWNRTALSGTITANSITTTVNGCMLVFMASVGLNGTITFTDPTGFGNQTVATAPTSGGSAVSDDMAQESFGPTGTITATVNLSTGNVEGTLIALTPANASGWTSTVETSYGSTEEHAYPLPGDRLGRAYYDGSGNIKFLIHTLGVGDGSPVTVDSTAGDNDVALNQPLAHDPTVGAYGRIFLCYERSIDSGSKAVLCIRSSDDLGQTWSAEHVIDDGTAHANTNSFYRVGCWANNGVVSVHYSYDSNSTFHTDGIWRAIGTYTGLGSVSWGATGLAYSTTGGQYEPNVRGAADGTVVVSWYDDGTNTNSAGDIYTVRSTDHGQTWPTSATKQTTTTDFGRPRLATNGAGVWGIVANKPWNGGAGVFASVYLLLSTDNGVTWSTPVDRADPGGSYSLDHPDIAMRGDFIGLLWRGGKSASTGHGFIYSPNGGTTWAQSGNPLGDATSSDAPRLLVTSSYLVITGYNQATSKTMQTQTTQFFQVAPSPNRVFNLANRTVGPMALRRRFRQPYWPQAASSGAAPVAYTLTASPGSVAITGDAATLPVGHQLTASPGSVAITGDPVTLPVKRALVASPGSIVITGDTALLPVKRVLVVSPGAIVINGDAATLVGPGATAYTLTALPGSVAITGDPTTLPVGHHLNATPGTVNITGDPATLPVARRFTVSPGTMNITGDSVTLPVGHHLNAAPGSVLITGDGATFPVKRFLTVGAGAVQIAGNAVVFAGSGVTFVIANFIRNSAARIFDRNSGSSSYDRRPPGGGFDG